MNILKIENGRLELRDIQGRLIRTLVSTGVVYGDINADQTLVLVTLSSGKVELRDIQGRMVRPIVSADAVNAKFYGNDIFITTNKGGELRDIQGRFIRRI